MNYCIDGTDEFGNYLGDAKKGPYVVFDINLQVNVAGPFPFWWMAKIAMTVRIRRDEMNMAEALGFSSVAKMRAHAAWIAAKEKQHADEKAYQASPEARARRQAANASNDTWVIPI